MTYTSHVLISSAIAYGIGKSLFPESQPELLTSFVLGAAIGSLLPDIDHPKSAISRIFPFNIISRTVFAFVEHRGITHSIWGIFAVAALFFIAYIFTGDGPLSYLKAIFPGIATGYFFHIMEDAITLSGIKNFCCGKQLVLLPRFMRFKTGSPAEYIYVFAIFASMVAFSQTSSFLHTLF